MSKMKELEHIADCVVDVLSEHLEHNIAWAVEDTIVDELDKIRKEMNLFV